MHFTKLLLNLTLLAVLLGSVMGCGTPDYYQFDGTVSHEGNPVPHVQIQMQPENPEATRPPMCMSDDNGKFEMTSGRERGVPPGNYAIHILDPAEAGGGRTSTEPAYLYVIGRYSPKNSDLKYEANSHQSNYELKLDRKD